MVKPKPKVIPKSKVKSKPAIYVHPNAKSKKTENPSRLAPKTRKLNVKPHEQINPFTGEVVRPSVRNLTQNYQRRLSNKYKSPKPMPLKQSNLVKQKQKNLKHSAKKQIQSGRNNLKAPQSVRNRRNMFSKSAEAASAAQRRNSSGSKSAAQRRNSSGSKSEAQRRNSSGSKSAAQRRKSSGSKSAAPSNSVSMEMDTPPSYEDTLNELFGQLLPWEQIIATKFANEIHGTFRAILEELNRRNETNILGFFKLYVYFLHTNNLLKEQQLESNNDAIVIFFNYFYPEYIKEFSRNKGNHAKNSNELNLFVNRFINNLKKEKMVKLLKWK